MSQPAASGFGSYASGSSAQGGVHSIYGDRQRMQYGVPETNGFAIASVILGPLGMCGFCCCAGLWLGIPGVICGHIARTQIEDSNGSQTGGGIAQAGLITSYLAVVITIAWIVYNMVTADQSPNFENWSM